MPRRAKTQDTLSAAFAKAVVLPIFVAMAAMGGVLGGGLFLAAEASDALSVERQARMVQQALAASIDQLAQNQESVALWKGSYQQVLRGAPDAQWLSENIGKRMYETFGHDQIYLLDRDARPIYAVTEGIQRAPAAYDVVAPLLRPMIDELRVRTRAGDSTRDSRNVTLLPSGVRMPDRAIHVARLAKVDGRPAAISVMVVIPYEETHHAIGSRQGYLVSVRFLGQAFLDELSRRNLLGDARFMSAPSSGSGERSLPLRAENNAIIGYIRWRPELPGAFILERIAPLAIGSFVFIVIILSLLVSSLRRASGQLQATLQELRVSEAQAQHLAHHDPLTELCNRAMLTTRIDQCLAASTADCFPALALLDLDRFKRVNDTLGHGAGDLLLKEVAARLRSVCPDHATVARLGGDEFAVLLARAPSDEDLRALCQEIVGALRRPFQLDGIPIHIGASIGVALADELGLHRTELLRRADIALFRTKAEGKNGYRFFEPAMDAHVRRRSAMEDDLRHALITGTGLTVHYQPLISARSGKAHGLEALVRWHHPVHGLLPPDQFVPVAEEVGLIVPLGEWVFREVCAATKRWPDLYFAINLSPLQFIDETPAARLLTIAREEQVDPRQIELEITESVLMADYPSIESTLSDLRDAGFSIALDDFGTGYSSLGYLRRFKVDKIKIDRSFVAHVGEDADAASIIAAMVSLGHSMGLRVTAEGVDTAEQSRFLMLAGCDELQGFHYSPAFPEDQIAAYLDEPAPRALSAA